MSCDVDMRFFGSRNPQVGWGGCFLQALSPAFFNGWLEISRVMTSVQAKTHKWKFFNHGAEIRVSYCYIFFAESMMKVSERCENSVYVQIVKSIFMCHIRQPSKKDQNQST
jgi:hypothetical protein